MKILSGLIAKLLEKRVELITTLVSFSGLIACWQILCALYANPLLLPPPKIVAVTAWKMILSGELFKHIAASLQRVLIGFATGSLCGLIIGVLIGRIKIVRSLLEPVIELVRPISSVAMIPIAIIWFGIGEPSRYFIIFHTAIFTVLINTAAGVAATPLIRIRAAESMGFNDLRVFIKVILPSSLPYILTGMRIGVALSFLAVVASEMIAAPSGIGYLIMQSRLLIQTQKLFVGLVTLGIVGAITDRSFRVLIEKTMSRYMQYLYQV